MEAPVELQTQSTALTRSLDSADYKKLSALEKEIFTACEMPHIRNFTNDEFTKNMLALIGKAHLNCGYTFDLNQVNLTIDELCNDLKKYNSTLSFQEIELAFKNGYKKLYGDFFGLNNATYFSWINAYTWNESRLKVKKMLVEAKENANKIDKKKSEKEVEEIMGNACLKSFLEFKSGFQFTDFGNVKYDFLDKRGLIKFTPERKKEIFEAAKIRVKQEAMENKQKNETIEKTLNKIFPDTIKSEAKKDALKLFFTELIESGIELLDII